MLQRTKSMERIENLNTFNKYILQDKRAHWIYEAGTGNYREEQTV